MLSHSYYIRILALILLHVYEVTLFKQTKKDTHTFSSCSLSNVEGVNKKVSVTHMQGTIEKGLTTVFPTRSAGPLTWMNREIRTLWTQMTKNTRTTSVE